RAAGQDRDGLLAGVDEVWIFVALVRERAHAEEAVLGVQPRVAFGQVVGDLGRQADAEVDERAGGDFTRRAARHVFGRVRHRFLVVLYSNAFSCSGTWMIL